MAKMQISTSSQCFVFLIYEDKRKVRNKKKWKFLESSTEWNSDPFTTRVHVYLHTQEMNTFSAIDYVHCDCDLANT